MFFAFPASPAEPLEPSEGAEKIVWFAAAHELALTQASKVPEEEDVAEPEGFRHVSEPQARPHGLTAEDGTERTERAKAMKIRINTDFQFHSFSWGRFISFDGFDDWMGLGWLGGVGLGGEVGLGEVGLGGVNGNRKTPVPEIAVMRPYHIFLHIPIFFTPDFCQNLIPRTLIGVPIFVSFFLLFCIALSSKSR